MWSTEVNRFMCMQGQHKVVSILEVFTSYKLTLHTATIGLSHGCSVEQWFNQKNKYSKALPLASRSVMLASRFYFVKRSDGLACMCLASSLTWCATTSGRSPWPPSFTSWVDCADACSPDRSQTGRYLLTFNFNLFPLRWHACSEDAMICGSLYLPCLLKGFTRMVYYT